MGLEGATGGSRRRSPRCACDRAQLGLDDLGGPGAFLAVPFLQGFETVPSENFLHYAVRPRATCRIQGANAATVMIAMLARGVATRPRGIDKDRKAMHRSAVGGWGTRKIRHSGWKAGSSSLRLRGSVKTTGQ